MRRLLVAALAVFAACANQPFVVDVSLRVVSSSPSSGATSVARKIADGSPAPIVISVSEELDPASVTPQAVALASVAADSTLESVPTTPPAFSIAPDGRFLLTMVPLKRLAYSHAYRVQLSTDLRRKRDGGRLPVTVKIDFTTENPPPLAILAVRPSDAATQVNGPTAAQERTPVLQVRFSEPVDCASVTAQNVALTEAFDLHPHTTQATRTVPGTWACNSPAASNPDRLEGTDCASDTSLFAAGSECVITFQPAGGVPLFSYSSALALALRGGKVSDLPLQSVRATAQGGQLPATATEHSTVVDPPALAITTTAPAAGATGVQRDASIALQFSEPVDCVQLKAVARIEEVRDVHPHIPKPLQLEAGTSKTRQLWPPISGGTGGGAWTCPSLAGVSAIDHSCGAGGARCLVTFTPSADSNNPAEAHPKPFEYSSTVRVTLPGSGYATVALLAARGSVESARATSQGGELPSTATFSFQTEDPPELLLASANPSLGGSSVPRGAGSILFTFDQPIDCGGDLTAAVLESYDPLVVKRLGGASAVVPGSGGGCTAGSNVFTWSPTSTSFLWQYSSIVTATLPAGSYGAIPSPIESAIATSKSGQLAASTAPDLFTTVDPPPVRLISVAPSPGAIDIPIAAPVTLGFSRAVDPASFSAANLSVAQATVQLVNGGSVSGGSVALDQANSGFGANNTSYTFAHVAPFNKSAIVTATVSSVYGPTGVLATDATTKGGWLIVQAADTTSPPTQTSLSVPFRAQDPDPLSLSFTQPNQGGQAAGNANILVSFSRPVICGVGATGPGLAADAAISASDLTLQGSTTPPAWSATCVAGIAGAQPNQAQLSLSNAANPPRPLDTVQVSIAQGIAANDATRLADGSEFGLLPTAASFNYGVEFSPLGIASTSPADGATAFNGTLLQVIFTSPVAPGSLVGCGAGGTPTATAPGTPSGCNFQLFNTTSGSVIGATVSTSTGAASTSVYFTAASALTTNDSYSLTLFGGFYVPTGTTTTAVRLSNASGTSYLPQNFSFSFTAGSPTVVSSTSPGAGANDIPVGAPLCLTFSGPVQAATLNSTNIAITYTDAQGTLALPWSGATNTAGNTWCLDLTTQSVLDCLGGNRTLLYGATYSVVIGTGVQLQGGNPTPSGLPLSYSFKTVLTPPALAPVTYANGFVPPTLLGGASAVPANAGFTVSLADHTESWVASSVVPNTTVILAKGQPPLSLGGPLVTVALGKVQISGGSFAVTPSAPLAYGQGYTLLLVAGAGGLQMQQGTAAANWLDSGNGYPVQIPFTTAAQTQALIGPYDAQIASEVLIPIVFSSPAALATATSTAIVGLQGGVQVNGFVSQYAPVPTAVNYLSQPTWPNNSALALAVQVNMGAGVVLDSIGNPIGAAGQSWSGTPNLSAITSQTPGGVQATNCVYVTLAGVPVQVSCSSTGATNQTLGDTPFAIAFATPGGTPSQRMQPDSFGPQTITLKPQGACSQSPEIPLAYTFVPGCTTATCPVNPALLPTTVTEDQVLLVPQNSTLVQNRILNSCTYDLFIANTQFTNLFGLTANSAKLTVTDLNYTVTGATVTPVLANFSAAAATGSVALSAGGVATGVSGRSTITAQLTALPAGTSSPVLDSIAPESVTGNVVGSVVSGGGAFPSATVTVSGSTVSLTVDPAQDYQTGKTYQVTFKSGIKDLAGNALGSDVSVQFQTETTPPTLQAANVSYVAQNAAFPNGAFKMVFSEPILASSLIDPTESGGVLTPGNIQLTDAKLNKLLGCALVDPVDGRIVYFQATGATGGVITAQAYTVTVLATVADLASNPLAAPVTTSVNVAAP